MLDIMDNSLIKFNQMLPAVAASRSDFPRNFMIDLPSKRTIKRSDWIQRKGSLLLKRLSILKRMALSRSFARFGIVATLIGTTAALSKIFRRSDASAEASEDEIGVRGSDATLESIALRSAGLSYPESSGNGYVNLLDSSDALTRALREYFRSVSGLQGSRTYNEEFDDLKFAEVVDALSEVITSIAYTRGCQPATLQSVISYSLYSNVPVGRRIRKLTDDIEKDAPLAHLNYKAMCAQINLVNAMTCKLFRV